MPPPSAREDLRGTITIILAGGQGERLHPLSRDRAKPAVPFGGTYRILDFTLSNCLNSGLRRVYVLTQYKSLSLDRHIRQGWHVLSEALGEFVVAIPPQQRLGGSWYKGTADAIFQNIYTLQEEKPESVLILSGDHVYKMDYGEMLAFHRMSGADLTVACVEVGPEEAPHYGIAAVDGDSRIVGWQEKPRDPVPIPGTKDRFLASMGVYIFDTESLVWRVSRDAKRETDHDFGKDVIPGMIEEDKVCAYRFRGVGDREGPYWRDIGRIDAYFDAHLDLLGEAPRFRLHDRDWPIWTRPTQLPPVKILEEGRIEDSLLAPGVVVRGGLVRRSVLGYEVCVGCGASVSDSILMDGVTIGEGARLRRVIVDKRVAIPAGLTIGHDRDTDSRRFTVTERGVVVVPKGVPL
jgi:glucose-1-phosphate adenylyltransferase